MCCLRVTVAFLSIDIQILDIELRCYKRPINPRDRLHRGPSEARLFNCGCRVDVAAKGCLCKGILLLSCVQHFAHEMTKVLRSTEYGALTY